MADKEKLNFEKIDIKESNKDYKKIDDLDIAKRKIFQHFSRYTV